MEILLNLAKENNILLKKLTEGETKEKKKTPPKKQTVEKFKLSTKDLLGSLEPKCAYMQKQGNCHCGLPAMWDVKSKNAVPITGSIPDDKKILKAFWRCNSCKTRATDSTKSKAYSVCFQMLNSSSGDTNLVIDDSLKNMINSPPKKKESPDIMSGLEIPSGVSSKNKFLKSNEKFEDSFVKVEETFVIIRKFKDKRKKDIVIGEIKSEPTTAEYEEGLVKPDDEILEKISLVYKTPEESISPVSSIKPPVFEEETEESDDASDGEDAWDRLGSKDDSEFRKLLES